MTKIILAVLLAALIAYVIGRIKRYRALKCDEALNALYPHPKPKVRQMAKPKTEDINREISKDINKKINTSYRYIGRYENLMQIPQNGDMTYKNGNFYVFCDGCWTIIG